MTDYKSQSDKMHDRLMGEIDARDRRNVTTIRLPIADLRRAARSLDSRADGILARRDRDPVLRGMAEAEAGHCRRLAQAIALAMRGVR